MVFCNDVGIGGDLQLSFIPEFEPEERAGVIIHIRINKRKNLRWSIRVLVLVYIKRQTAGRFDTGNQTWYAQVKFRTIAALFGTVALLALFSGCAGLDNYLETYLRSEPLAIFECEVLKAENDAVIILGIKDSSLIAGYRKWKTIGFFLKNTNTDGSTGHLSIENKSRLFQFFKVDKKSYDNFTKKLNGMELFAVNLKDQTVRQESLWQFKILGDGELRNMLPRQVDSIKNRQIQLVVINFAPKNPAPRPD